MCGTEALEAQDPGASAFGPGNLELWYQSTTYPVTYPLHASTYDFVGIASASQRDHWHRYIFTSHLVLSTKGFEFVSLRHGWFEMRKSATGGI